MNKPVKSLNVHICTTSLFRTIKNNKRIITLHLTKLVYLFSMVFTLSIGIYPAHAQTGIRGNLNGHVTDNNGAPLSHVNLRLMPDMHISHSDEAGNFKFSNIIAGSYKLHVSSLGYAPQEIKVSIAVGKTIRLDIQLAASDQSIEDVLVEAKVGNPDNLIDVSRSAMPVKVIDRRQIELMGSRRLDEVLREQTGVAMVNDIASGSRAVGIQMQGFSSQYIMVLVDGQPMVGRNNGNLDLSRISVTNVERIEIIKGATSCLYGSEALGGAINIITRHGAVEPQARAALFYGTRNLVDATLEGETPFQGQRGSILLTGNYYRNDGFNTDRRYMNGQTIPPTENLTLQSRVRYQLNEIHTVGLQARLNSRRSNNNQAFGRGASLNNNLDNLRDDDINITLNLNSNYSNGLRSMLRYYYTQFDTKMDIVRENSNALLSNNEFNEYNHRIEQQFAYAASSSLKFTSGLGGNLSQMRDASVEQSDLLWNAFAYTQADYIPSETINFVAGLRYDHAGTYGGQLSPSFGAQYHPTEKLTFKVGFGRGFIAPDFKKRYQIFYNALQGYTVMGAEVVKQGLRDLQAAGEISNIQEYTLSNLPDRLLPESSTSFNAGWAYSPSNKLKLEGSWFYHRQENFINTLQIARKINQEQIYTFENIALAYNTGFELSASYSPMPKLDVNIGYQYLITKNKGIIDSISAGRHPYYSIRDARTGTDRASVPSDYIGLWNRSRHMLNANITYRMPWSLTATARANFRSRYGFDDANSNGFYDRYDIEVAAHVIVYASLEKRFRNNRLTATLTAENLFDYVDRLIPGQMGRLLSAGLTYRLFKG